MGTILLYTMLRYQLGTKLGILPFEQELWNFWIPFYLPFISFWACLGKRVRILKLKSLKNKYISAHQALILLMVLAMSPPMILSQKYLDKVPHGLIEIDDFDEIKNHQKEKFFVINQFDVDKGSIVEGFSTREVMGGKYSRARKYFYVDMLYPFKNVSGVWYGIEYSKNINGKKDNKELKQVKETFYRTSKDSFISQNLKEVKYFEKLNNSYKRSRFLKAINKNRPLVNIDSQIILIPKMRDYKNRTGISLGWIFGSYVIGCVCVLIIIAIPKLDKRLLTKFNNN
ncbi:hypothetical protein [Flagellimonas marinaquae]|uniref:hypothetical protein n=1 Tax=Flagellimonas marinaquae TaxID=254955 RepID=UPI0020759D0C|nr:hypothetical protein [Allomuricauda aquimarina]USD26880.1 hypothetical protein MJO53_08275 [Allomuricauda aquimarina]